MYISILFGWNFENDIGNQDLYARDGKKAPSVS